MATTTKKTKEYSSFPVLTKTGKPAAARGIEAGTEEIEGKSVIDAVKEYVEISTKKKELEKRESECKNTLRSFAGKVRNFFIGKGEYQKTYRIFGKKTKTKHYAVDAQNNDKFSLPTQKEDMDNLKKLLGKDTFNQIFEPTITISIKKTVVDNPAKIRELSKKLYDALGGAEGVKEYFEREESWQVKKGMAEEIHNFDKKTKSTFFEYVKQAEDTIKNATA